MVLLRENHARLEVLLTRRSAQLAFMGDVWVFPGGRLDESDVTPETTARVPTEHRDRCGVRLAGLDGRPLEAGTSVGLHVAGCRETFEECGVMLARRADGSACDPAQVERLKRRREGPVTGDRPFLDLLLQEDLYLDVARLVYWAHWITPAIEPKRYDTRFFAVEVPCGQEACVDRHEATEHAWLTAEEAFARAGQGSMKLAPPTLATLQDLAQAHARHGSLQSMLEQERQREVPPVLPKWIESGGRVTVVMPWDPQYAELPGEGVPVAERYPPYLASLPSRREVKARPARAP